MSVQTPECGPHTTSHRTAPNLSLMGTNVPGSCILPQSKPITIGHWIPSTAQQTHHLMTCLWTLERQATE